ncbi:MAG: PKD domain-containing protein [Bacteroidetes bacterium]|nr:MAG: PKD domain-containing protein [Bacteroidota bacterium]
MHDFEKFQGEVYVAGYFTQINGAPATYLAKLTGSGWVSVGTFNGRVYELANAGDSLLYAVGDFTQVDGNSAMARAARYDGNSWAALGQGVTGGQVYTVGIHPVTGAAYLGGTLSSVRQADGTTLSVARLVKWENGQWSAVGDFTNEPSFTRVNHLTFDAEATLYLTGGFVMAGGETVNHLMRWNPAFGVAGFGLGLNHAAPTPGAPGEKIVLTDSSLYVLGSFYKAGINQSMQIARYHLDDPATGAIVVDLGADTTACGELVLDAGLDDVDYIWNTGAQTRSITVSATGWYAVTAFNGNCADEDSIFVTVVPVSPVFATDTVAGCDEIEVDAGPGYSSYAWSTGDTSQTTWVNDNSPLTVTVIDPNGCVITDTIFAEITGYSPSATFTFAPDDEDQMAFDASGSYEGETYSWDFGDGTTGSGVQVIHTYSQNDTFLVTLVVENGCGTDTLRQTVVVDFLTSLTPWQAVAALRLFPNPAREAVVVEGSLGGQEVGLALLDLNGRHIWTRRVALRGGRLETELDLRGLAPGVYLIQLAGAGGTGYLRLAVQ